MADAVTVILVHVSSLVKISSRVNKASSDQTRPCGARAACSLKGNTRLSPCARKRGLRAGALARAKHGRICRPVELLPVLALPPSPPTHRKLSTVLNIFDLHTRPPAAENENHVGVPSSTPIPDICPRAPAPDICPRCLSLLTSALCAPPSLVLLMFGTNGFLRSPSLTGGRMLDGIGGLHR